MRFLRGLAKTGQRKCPLNNFRREDGLFLPRSSNQSFVLCMEGQTPSSLDRVIATGFAVTHGNEISVQIFGTRSLPRID